MSTKDKDFLEWFRSNENLFPPEDSRHDFAYTVWKLKEEEITQLRSMLEHYRKLLHIEDSAKIW